MLTNAIVKLKTEMDGNKNNHYVQVVGGFLLQHLEANPADAERIMAEGKTIAKSLDGMKEAARRKQSAGVAVLTDAEGFAVVLEYFRNYGAAQVSPTLQPVTVVAPASKSDFDVRLEDLL